MKILAIAKPNKNYRYLKNIVNIHFEARLKNNRVSIWEIDLSKKWNREVSKKSILYLFPVNTEISNTPFLISENINFWVCVRCEKYIEKFNHLKNSRL